MCGIIGILEKPSNSLSHTIGEMTKSLKHRGPDDSGTWTDEKLGIALGHTRLSIVDLSQEGHQPKASKNGRYVMSYNGEVYNFKTIRKELENLNVHFSGTGDTEVMLEAFETWGIENAIKKFVGMFAFALWDKKENKLILARDRLGIKPLYFGWAKNSFLFASELKAFLFHPQFSREINRDVLTLYLRFGNFPAPYSIYQNVYKLLPGTILEIPLSALSNPNNFSADPENQTCLYKPKKYWNSQQIAMDAVHHLFQGTEEEAAGELERLLDESIQLRMIADVPLGAFLSGGVDSSTVVAFMQKNSLRPVKTFTIGFSESDYNEAVHAKQIASHLKTDHTELYLSSQEAMDVIPLLPHQYDEPFSDSSQIPTYLVSKLARQHVTVSLSGDGGDELFGGYTRHHTAKKISWILNRIPFPLRKFLSSSIHLAGADQWSKVYNMLRPILPSSLKVSQPSSKISKLATLLKEKNASEVYKSLVSHWGNPTQIVLNATEPPSLTSRHENLLESWNFTQWIMYLDAISYLPDDLLTKVDRASMAVSLEARVPLIDHRLVEFAWRLPLEMKIKNGKGKKILRKVLYKYVPQELIERPKMGFSIPLGDWLRNGLRDWAESLLNPEKLKNQGFFDPAPIRKKWEEHLSKKQNWEHQLWDILMFGAWYESQKA